MGTEKKIRRLKSNDSFDQEFPIGEPVEASWNNTKCYAAIRAVKFRHYIMIDTPTDGHHPLKPDYNAVINLRYLNRGRLFSLKTVLLRTHNKPPLMVLEYPDTMTEVTLRESKRIRLLIPSRYDIGNGWQEGTILNLSSGGLMIGVKETHTLKKQHPISLSFALPGKHEKETIWRGEVRKIKEAGDRQLLGILINEPNEDISSKLRGFYNKALILLGEEEE